MALLDDKIGTITRLDGYPIGQSVAAAGSFTTLAASGNATVGGTLGVTGAATFGGTAQAGPAQVYNHITTSVTSNNIALSGANITGGWLGVFVDVTTTISAGCALTLPSVAATVTAMESAGFTPVAGMSYEMDVYNDQSGSYNFTLTVDSGATWTLSGTAQTIAKGTMRKFLVTLTSLTAGTIQSLGEFTVTAAP